MGTNINQENVNHYDEWLLRTGSIQNNNKKKSKEKKKNNKTRFRSLRT